MKKTVISVLLLIALTATACGSKAPAVTGNFDYKVGTASYTHTNNSYGYTEGKNGRGAVSTTLVAAVFDKNGNIVRISIDEVESNIGFDGTGQLADFSAGEVRSKKELGDAYGMKAASGIGKEWYQQIESLEKWLEGKAVNTIIGGVSPKMYGGGANSANSYNRAADSTMTGTGNMNNVAQDIMDGANSVIDDMTDSGKNPAGTTGQWMDADLKASVTIDTTYIEKAIEKEWRNAK